MTAASADIDSRLGDLLLSTGRLDAAALERARRLRDGSGEPLHAVLTKLGLVSERDLAATLADLLGLGVVGPDDYPDAAILGDTVSSQFLRNFHLLPLAHEGGRLVLAVADPLDSYGPDAVGLASGLPVEGRVAVPAELEAALERIEGMDGTSP